MTKDKRTLYRTATATLACQHFQAGERVSVRFSRLGDNGTAWFYIPATERGPIDDVVSYPEHHLTRFVL